MGNQQGKERRDYGRKIDWTSAERPLPPGKPFLVSEGTETDVITIRWSPPTDDGGAPIIGYVVEHRRTGSPHWLRATPNLTLGTELPLTGLEPGWRYQFRVIAENDIGRSDPGELSEPLTVTPQKWAASAPFFNMELQNTIGLENEKVEFKVHVIAVPPPTISWYKDGFEIFSSRRTKIVTENDQSTFIIHQAALEDEGEIKCTATNRAGHAVTRAILKLEAPPRIRLPRQYEDGLIFEKGELIRLKVTTAGRPKPEVSWYHNGELIQKGGRFEIMDSETGSVVKINDACREDRGEYVIKGTNKIGEDAASFLVTVTDSPSAPGKVEVTVYGRAVTLSWSSPEDDGGCKIGSYIVEYFRVGWDMWLKAKNCRQLSTILEDLIEGSEYKFRVRAENPYGISEPSKESDVIFLPDVKRGILKPTMRKDVSDILKEPKHVEIQENHKDETEESRRRRLLEENAKKLLDTPLSVLLPYDNAKYNKFDKVAKKRAESSSDFSTVGVEENAPPPIPKRKKRLTPSPVDTNPVDSEKVSTGGLDSGYKSRLTPSPIDASLKRERQTPSPVLMSVDILNGNATKPIPTFKSNSNNDMEFKEHELFRAESPMYPRENDDSILHGSSELMLVIYPRDRSKSVELSAQQRSEIEMNLTGESIAPPMSLSAPELGTGETFELPPMRDAISSTELLYERTTARLYQDALDEEAQSVVKRRYSMDRKSAERRSSMKEQILERRHSYKENYNEETKQIKEKTPEKVSKIPVKKTIPKSEEPQPKISKTKISDVRERLSSVERERLEFALVRERLKKREEEQKALKGMSGSSNTTPTTTSSSVEPEDLDEEEEYEDDDYLEEEEEEEDYLDGQKKEEREDEDYFDDDSMTSSSSGKLLTETLTLKPRKMAPYAEQEDDTYHPRSMIPTRSVFVKVEKPEELKVELPKIPEKATPVEPVEPLAPPTQPTPTTENKIEEKEQKVSKIPVKAPSKDKTSLFKRLGLKKEKKVPEITTDPVDPNQPLVIPKPILKNKILPKKKDSIKAALKLSVTKPVEKPLSEEESESEVQGKKKKVRIAEPKEQEEQALKKKVEPRVDENAKENAVLIFHYSDIVKEYGGPKKPPARLYLNYDELKAHAKPEEPISKVSPVTQPIENKVKFVQNKVTEKKPEKKVINKPETKKEEVKNEEVQKTVTEEVQPAPKVSQSESKFYLPPMEYLADVIMFIIACWLYLFKNELYAIPVLCIMAYKQLKDMTIEKYNKIKTSISKRIPDRLKELTGYK